MENIKINLSDVEKLFDETNEKQRVFGKGIYSG